MAALPQPVLAVTGKQGGSRPPAGRRTGRGSSAAKPAPPPPAKQPARPTPAQPGATTQPPPRRRAFSSRPRVVAPPRRPLDTTLAWGDCVALLCTQLASDDIPVSEAAALGSIMVVAFCAVAAAKGDYTASASSPGLDPFSRRRAMVRALGAAGTTWLAGVPAALVGDALLLRSHAIGPDAFLSGGGTAGAAAAAAASAVAPAAAAATAVAAAGGYGGPPPIAEVLVSALVTLCSWRGIYAGLKGILL